MKKILLLAALAASCAPAFADEFSDIFTLTYEGETITDGQTITVKDYYDPIIRDYPELNGVMDPDYESAADIHANNISDEPKELQFSLNVITPTAAEFNAGEYGFYQLCYSYQSGGGTCLEQETISKFVTDIDPVSAEEYMSMDIHQKSFKDFTPVTLQLDLRVMDEDKEVATSTIYINFTHEFDSTLAVNGIEAETTAEYFTIQGIRVAEPQKGQIYIERKGSKVVKRIF